MIKPTETPLNRPLSLIQVFLFNPTPSFDHIQSSLQISRSSVYRQINLLKNQYFMDIQFIRDEPNGDYYIIKGWGVFSKEEIDKFLIGRSFVVSDY